MKRGYGDITAFRSPSTGGRASRRKPGLKREKRDNAPRRRPLRGYESVSRYRSYTVFYPIPPQAATLAAIQGCGLLPQEKKIDLPIGDVNEHAIHVSYTHLRAHETVLDLVCRLLLEKKKKI